MLSLLLNVSITGHGRGLLEPIGEKIRDGMARLYNGDAILSASIL